MSQLAARRMAEAYAHYTFHPCLSQRSLQMAQRIQADFQVRQQQLLLRRQRKASREYTFIFDVLTVLLSLPTDRGR